MPSVVRQITLPVLILAMGTVSLVAFGASGPGTQAAHKRTDKAAGTVAAKALQIVSDIHGTWQQMPGNIANGRMTSGALIGNGSVGVAIGGTADKQQYYIGRNDFWSVLRGSIMPVGQLQLTVPSLHGGTGQLNENIGTADVTGSFTQGSSQLKTQAWVAAGQNTLFIQLENAGQTPLQVSAAMLDGFSQKDRETLGGVTGDVTWLKVSPEVVHATIGGVAPPTRQGRPGAPAPQTAPPSRADVQASEASIRSVQIFDSYAAAKTALPKPVYQWASQNVLAGGSGNDAPAMPNVFSCGDIIMPERRFTVRASINLDHAGGQGVIFSSLVEHRWMQQAVDPSDPLGNTRGHDVPRAQGAEAGLLVYLADGKLAANLNGTVVTSKDPIPLNQWAAVEVAYDGIKMVLRIDGAETGETSAFPSTAEVMGPKFEWMAAHPGGPQIAFDGAAPDGVLATRVLGAQVSSENGEMHFTILAGGHVIVALTAMDDRDTADYLHSATSGLQQATAATIAAIHSRHVAWWQNFWSKSFVEIPDKTVQSWWYGSLYVLASCSKSGNVAPGLWGNWITTTNPGWDGDYTLDYNYQAPFWAAFPTNHVDLADPYDPPILAWIERGRGLALDLHAQGLVYYTHLAPSPGWSADNFRSLDQKSDALFAAVNMVQRWCYTRDAAYARKVWPFLTGVADFWDHDLKLVDGRYVDSNDAEDEHLWGPADDVNPATVIGFLNMLYPALIDISDQLNTGKEMRSTWSNILAHLSPLPLAPADSVAAIREAVGKPIPHDRMVILESEHGMQWVTINRGDRFSDNLPVAIQGSSAGMNSLQVVFPAWNIGVESSPEMRQAAQNTVDYTRLWYDSNNTSNFYPAAASAGYDPDSILDHLNLLVTHIGYASFAYKFGAGGVENEATVPTTIAGMLLQSYQKNIHVFANWPKNQDASFGDLLAVGDFLVSSSMSGGKVENVRITSQIGGPCNLANPWGPDEAVRVQIAGKQTRVLRGAVLNIPTVAGETLLFAPLAK